MNRRPSQQNGAGRVQSLSGRMVEADNPDGNGTNRPRFWEIPAACWDVPSSNRLVNFETITVWEGMARSWSVLVGARSATACWLKSGKYPRHSTLWSALSENLFGNWGFRGCPLVSCFSRAWIEMLWLRTARTRCLILRWDHEVEWRTRARTLPLKRERLSSIHDSPWLALVEKLNCAWREAQSRLDECICCFFNQKVWVWGSAPSPKRGATRARQADGDGLGFLQESSKNIPKNTSVSVWSKSKHENPFLCSSSVDRNLSQDLGSPWFYI